MSNTKNYMSNSVSKSTTELNRPHVRLGLFWRCLGITLCFHTLQNHNIYHSVVSSTLPFTLACILLVGTLFTVVLVIYAITLPYEGAAKHICLAMLGGPFGAITRWAPSVFDWFQAV